MEHRGRSKFLSPILRASPTCFHPETKHGCNSEVGVDEMHPVPVCGTGAKDGAWKAQRMECHSGVPASRLQDANGEAARQGCGLGGEDEEGTKHADFEYRDELCDATCPDREVPGELSGDAGTCADVYLVPRHDALDETSAQQTGLGLLGGDPRCHYHCNKHFNFLYALFRTMFHNAIRRFNGGSSVDSSVPVKVSPVPVLRERLIYGLKLSW